MSSRDNLPVELSSVDVERLGKAGRLVLDRMVSLAKKVNNGVLDVEHLAFGLAKTLGEYGWLATSEEGLGEFCSALESALWDQRKRFEVPKGASGLCIRPEAVEVLEKLPGLTQERVAGLLDKLAENMTGWSRDLVVSSLAASAPGNAGGPPPISGDEPTPDTVLELEPGEQPDEQVEQKPAQEKGGFPEVPFATGADQVDGLVEALQVEAWTDTTSVLATAMSTLTPTAAVLHGETACERALFLRHFVAMAMDGRFEALKDVPIYFLDHARVLAMAVDKGTLPAGFLRCVEAVADKPNAVLVLENAELLLEPAPFGRPLALLKPLLVQARTRVVLSLSTAAFEAHLVGDDPLKEHLVPVALEPCSLEELAGILRADSGRLEEHHRVRFAADLFDEVARMHVPLSGEPRNVASAQRLLDEVAGFAALRREPTVTCDLLARYLRKKLPGPRVDVLAGLGDLEPQLNRIVLHQPEAVGVVAHRVKQTKLKLDRRPERPDGVFLFVGPSGVGKTLLGKAICMCLFGALDRMIRLDMSEYMEPHSVAKIIGSPPGYVGYGEQAALTGPAGKTGEGVILLDEIEKAHPQVLNIFLQLFDEGFLTDARQNRVCFSDFTVIMTSNLGKELWEAATPRKPVGFEGAGEDAEPPGDPSAKRVLHHFMKLLPSEFLNRVDEVVPFRTLHPKHLVSIASDMLDQERKRWEARFDKSVTIAPELTEFLANMDYLPAMGARHLERNLERHVIRRLADAALSPAWTGAQNVAVELAGDQVKLTVR